MDSPRRLLVIGGVALGVLPGGALVVSEMASGRQVARTNATLSPFMVGDDKVAFAGPKERPEHARTVIVTPDDSDPYPVTNGAWMSHPVPFRPGMTVTMIAQDDAGHELFRVESDALKPNDAGEFRPMFGPDWVGYAPMDED